jgi:hypothetical protein
LVARRTIETIVQRYLWMTERFDPRSPEVVAAKARWAKVAEHAQKYWTPRLPNWKPCQPGPIVHSHMRSPQTR